MKRKDLKLTYKEMDELAGFFPDEDTEEQATTRTMVMALLESGPKSVKELRHATFRNRSGIKRILTEMHQADLIEPTEDNIKSPKLKWRYVSYE